MRLRLICLIGQDPNMQSAGPWEICHKIPETVITLRVFGDLSLKALAASSIKDSSMYYCCPFNIATFSSNPIPSYRER